MNTVALATERVRRRRRRYDCGVVGVAAAILVVMPGGCASSRPRPSFDRDAGVFFFGGAGDGDPLTTSANCVKEGLAGAGYLGDVALVGWNTGLGVLVDEIGSVDYKRRRAAEFADRIVRFIDTHPGHGVHVIAQSAGTAVATFALEALPADRQVENVVFLGSALSAHYDMTTALMHVRGRMFVFTSDHDLVLSLAVPLTGTADRQYCGACAAGLLGLHAPTGASGATLAQYAKIENIRWRPEFARASHFGGHSDTVNTEFIERFVAPLLWPRGPRFIDAGPQPSSESGRLAVPSDGDGPASLDPNETHQEDLQ